MHYPEGCGWWHLPTIIAIFEKDVPWLICGHNPQSRSILEENLSFYDELKGEWQSVGALFMCIGVFNGYVGRHISGLDGVYAIGQRNFEGGMLLEFCLEKELCVSNT